MAVAVSIWVCVEVEVDHCVDVRFRVNELVTVIVFVMVGSVVLLLRVVDVVGVDAMC